ncbi:MAG: hypothetical protein ACRBCJ_11235 [Hyphomicrobiaceae bacterium]
MRKIDIVPFTGKHKDAVIELSIDAWTLVFALTENDVPHCGCQVGKAFRWAFWLNINCLLKQGGRCVA